MKKIFNRENKKQYRRELRKRLTTEELIVWSMLKKYFSLYKCRRQFGIGPYIADFYIYALQLVIEIDGSQHLENMDYDLERDQYLESLGITTLRYWNHDVRNNLDGVIISLEDYIKKYTN